MLVVFGTHVYTFASNNLFLSFFGPQLTLYPPTLYAPQPPIPPFHNDSTLAHLCKIRCQSGTRNGRRKPYSIVLKMGVAIKRLDLVSGSTFFFPFLPHHPPFPNGFYARPPPFGPVAVWQIRPCDSAPSGTPPEAMHAGLLTQAPSSKYCFRLHAVHAYPALPARQSHAAQFFSLHSQACPLFGPSCFLLPAHENSGSQKFL